MSALNLDDCTARLRESLFEMPDPKAIVARSPSFTGLIDGICQIELNGVLYRYEMFEGEGTQSGDFERWLESIVRKPGGAS